MSNVKFAWSNVPVLFHRAENAKHVYLVSELESVAFL